MPVSNAFAASSLDLNGKVTLSQPTALAWGPDGRLYVTEVDGDLKILTVVFGDKAPGDSVDAAAFYVASAVTLNLVRNLPNRNDDGQASAAAARQVTGIDVKPHFDAQGNPVLIEGKPAAVIYVTSSDSRVGAGGTGADINLDTNSGVLTRIVQTGPNSWEAVDLVRGLPRSEENHAPNGLEVVQELDAEGRLLSSRILLASGGNTNTGAPSNNFAGQPESPLSGALLEIDLDALAALPLKTDAASGRKYVYDLPTLDDPLRAGANDAGDPFGGADGRNPAVLEPGGPVRIYSPGYRNPYDVEVTEDGRVFTYDNGANNSWGGRPIGEAGDNGGTVDFQQALGYIATNLNNGEGNTNDDINLVNWNPANKDQLHEATRSDDLAGRARSEGQGGAATYSEGGLTHVYGGHPNPTRASGTLAGVLFTPKAGTESAFLLVSSEDSAGDGGGSDYQAVIAWLAKVEQNNTSFPSSGIYGAAAGALTQRVLAVKPGEVYDIYEFAGGAGAAVLKGGPAPAGGVLLGQAGLPADYAEIVPKPNPIEGDYLEGGRTDGAVDTGTGSINGLAEYTSTVLDGGDVRMSGALIASQLNGGNLIVIGRNAEGVVESSVSNGFSVAADRTVIPASGGPLGLSVVGDEYAHLGLSEAFRGSIWAATFNQNGPFIEIFQPDNGAVPLAGQPAPSPDDRDRDGLDYLVDPFEFSAANGYPLGPGESLVIDFNPQNASFPDSLSGTGLLGAALDGATPNRDAQTAAENFPPAQQRDGLYDIGGNVLPGGNAPILQIKTVTPGSVVGAGNQARDVLHTGVRLDPGVDRLVATLDLKNWIPAQGGVAVGQLSGLIFGDGTQANFLRFVFGEVNGAPGFEVGLELGDSGYTVLGALAAPGLASSAVSALELRLEIDLAAGYALDAGYRLEGQAQFTPLPLGGAVLPHGVLRNVLSGDHFIAGKASGAAFGFLAETSPGAALNAIDFNGLQLQAFSEAPQPQAERVLYRLNAGDPSASLGGTIASSDGGPAWIGDGLLVASGPVQAQLSGSKTFTQSLTNSSSEIDLRAVPGGTPWQLFAHERYDPAGGETLRYDFEVETGGRYRVTLFYTENWNGAFAHAAANGGETRRFDVAVEGSVPAAFDDIDPLAEAAAYLGQPLPGGSATDAQKQPFLGLAFSRDHVLTASDDTLSLEFLREFENPKINAIQISRLEGDYDQQAPQIASISVENPPSVQDGPRLASVRLTDDSGFDPLDFRLLDGDELIFSGIIPEAVSAPKVSLSADGRTATLAYTLEPPTGGAWPAGQGEIRINAGAFVDAAGNLSAAAQASFQQGSEAYTPGAILRAINVGGGAIAKDPVLGFALEAENLALSNPDGKKFTDVGASYDPGGNAAALDGSALESERFGPQLGFEIPLANGRYFVELYFAEIFHTQAGKRVFDVRIEGDLAVDDLDLAAESLARTPGAAAGPLGVRQLVEITDGFASIQLNASLDNAKLGALVVRAADPLLDTATASLDLGLAESRFVA